MRRLSSMLTAALLFGGLGTSAMGQPLVTGDLSIYYAFEEFIEEDLLPFVVDDSGNGLNGGVVEGFDDANGDGLPDIVIDTDNKVRGNGSIRFDADPQIAEDYVFMCDPVSAFACEVPDNLIPKTGFTVAAWMNVQQTGTDQSIYQTRSGDGAFVTHAQVQGNGRLRIQLRGQGPDAPNNIAGAQVFTDGTEDNLDASVAFDEWFHYAVTYDQPGNTWAMYYNGEEIAGGATNGDAGNIPLGDWGQGATIGIVPDFARQLVGNMDEFYVFTRALSVDEIGVLVNLEEGPGPPGTILGTGTESLLGNDLTDLGDDGDETAYSIDPFDPAGFDAEFFSSDEPGFGGGESAFNVFDNLLGPGNDKWCCGTAFPQIVGADLGRQVELTHFTVSSANDVDARDPRVWSIEGSNDGENWTAIFSQDNPDASLWNERLQVIQFTAGEDFDAPAEAYSQYRMVTDATGATEGAFFQLGEIEFFGNGGSQVCGDFDMDGDVDSADRTTQTTNWTGALPPGDPNATKTFPEGDCDADGDIDTADQNGLINNWTGAMNAGNLEDGDNADLIYDPATGNVKLDAGDTGSGQFISFVLGTGANNMRPENLVKSADGSAGPFFDVGTNTDATTFQIGQTDPLNQGAGPVIDLGNVFPAGIENVELLAEYLTLAEYASELGQGGTLDLIYVPEPSSLALALIGMLGLLKRGRRK